MNMAGSENFLFARAAAQNIGQVGAVVPSSPFLVEQLIKQIDFSAARHFVELGPGTGALSKKLLRLCAPAAMLYAFEINDLFCRYLKNSIDDKRFIVINENALYIQRVLVKRNVYRADYIFSGLPFSFLPGKTQTGILVDIHSHLTPKGKFIMYQYSRSAEGLLKKIFPRVETHFVLFNIPPAFVFVCSKESNN